MGIAGANAAPRQGGRASTTRDAGWQADSGVPEKSKKFFGSFFQKRTSFLKERGKKFLPYRVRLAIARVSAAARRAAKRS